MSKEVMPRISATFMVVGNDDDPNELEAFLGMVSDEVGRRGEHKPSRAAPGRSYVVKDSFWEVRAEPIEDSYALQDYVEASLNRISAIEPKLAALPITFIKRILVQVSVPPDSSIPGLRLKPALMDRLSRLGVELEVDIN